MLFKAMHYSSQNALLVLEGRLFLAILQCDSDCTIVAANSPPMDNFVEGIKLLRGQAQEVSVVFVQYESQSCCQLHGCSLREEYRTGIMCIPVVIITSMDESSSNY